jgi:hypothetical protein
VRGPRGHAGARRQGQAGALRVRRGRRGAGAEAGGKRNRGEANGGRLHYTLIE